MALNLGTLTAKITADTADFEAKMSAATAKGAAFGIGIAALGQLALDAARGISNFAIDSVKSFAEAEAAQLRLNAAIRGSSQAISAGRLNDYAQELSRLTTFEDDAAISAERTMVAYGLSEDQIHRLLPVVADLATGMGTGLAEAAQIVVRSMDMGSGALSRSGIHMSEYQKAVFESASANERLSMTAELVEKSMGGISEAMSDTFLGRVQRLGNAFGELMESFGGWLTKAAGLIGLTSTIGALTDLLQGAPGESSAPPAGGAGEAGGIGGRTGKKSERALLTFGPIEMEARTNEPTKKLHVEYDNALKATVMTVKKLNFTVVDLTADMKKLGSFAATQGTQLASSLSPAISGAIQGGTTAGPMGAILGFGVSALSQSEQFQELQGNIGDVVGGVGNALGTLLTPINDLFHAFDEATPPVDKMKEGADKAAKAKKK